MSRRHRTLNLNAVPPAGSGFAAQQPQAGMSVTPAPKHRRPAQPGSSQQMGFPAQAQVSTTIPSAYDGLIQRIVLAIEPLLSTHQIANATRLDRLESGLASLTTQVSAGQKDAEARAKRLAEHVTRSSTIQKRSNHDLANQFNDLKSIIGTSALATDKKTLWGCLDQITFSVEEALERGRDLDAPAPEPTLRHEMGTNTEPIPTTPSEALPENPLSRVFASVGVETEVPHTTEQFTRPSTIGFLSQGPSRINLKQLDSSQASSWRPRALPHTRKPATFRITTSSPSHSPSLSPADWSRNGPPLHLLHCNPVVPKAADRGAVAGGDDTPVSDHPSVSDVPKQSTDALPSSISGDLQTNHQLALSQSTLLPDESANLSPSALGDNDDHPPRSPTPKSSMLPPADDAFLPRSPSPLRVDVASPVSPSFSHIAHSPSASPVTPKQTAPLPTASQKPAEVTIPAPSPLGNFSSVGSPHPPGPGSPDMRDTPLPRRAKILASARGQPAPLKSQPPKASQTPRASVPATGSNVSPISIQSSPSPAPEPSRISPMFITSDDNGSKPIKVVKRHARASIIKPIRRMVRIPTSPSPAPEPSSVSPMIITSDDSDSEPVKVVRRKTARASIKATPSARRVSIPKTTATKDKQQSAAATRVKKRKPKASEIEMEPPLKKARMRMSTESSVGAGPSAKPRKGARKSDAAVPTCDWPKQAGEGADGFGQNFLQCDMCSLWYHYGCVGIVVGDPRLKPAEIFTCPPCESGRGNIRARRATGGLQEYYKYSSEYHQTCNRPDCTQDKNGDICLVAGIIGRRKDPSGEYEWLVKWDGYPITRATWQDEESMGDSQTLIKGFQKKARDEGVDWGRNEDFLLEEAIDGGWSL